jgi:hypothetical protein
MPVPRAVTNQFESELHEGDHQPLRVNDGARSGVLQSHAGLTEPASDFPNDLEEFQSEDSLGCARGVLWSLVFEAALVFAGVIFWLLRLTL